MNPVKRYVNAIEWKLKLPWKVRARVMSDLSTSMTARREAGETDEAIMADLGTPAEVAARLNAEMAEYAVPKSSPWRWLFLAAAALSLLWLLFSLAPFFMVRQSSASIGVIGGADGPTAIFVTAQPQPLLFSISAGVSTLLACVSFYVLLRGGRPPQRRTLQWARGLALAGLGVLLLFPMWGAFAMAGAVHTEPQTAGLLLFPRALGVLLARCLLLPGCWGSIAALIFAAKRSKEVPHE